MNTDIRLSVGFWSHPKTKKTVRRLGLEGIRSLQILWLWAAQYRPEGDLSDMDWEDIELAGDWQGEERAFFDVCLSLAWIDETPSGYVLHDWQEHNSWAANAELRSDMSRFSRMAGVMPKEYRLLEQAGFNAINKDVYESLKNSNDRLTFVKHMLNERLTSVNESSNETLTPAPSPSPVREEERECVFNAHAQVAISVPEMPIQTTAQDVPPAAFSSSPDVGFEDFFDAFPARHRGSEAKAAEVWQALRLNRAFPGLSRVLHALEAWKASDQWLAQGGRFIPSAENFLAKEYWQRDPGLPQSQQPRGQPRASSLRQQQMQNADTVAQMLLAKRKSKEESHRRNRNANNPNDATGLLGTSGQSIAALPASVPYTCTAS